MSGNIPGFQTLKDRVIKPLIFATEKVVEYYMQEDEAKGDKRSFRPINSNVGQHGLQNNEELQIGTAFNLQRKFERLHISRDNLSTRSFIKSEIPSFTGLGKRTFRELERWDIEDESPATLAPSGNRSAADCSEERIDQTESISNLAEDEHSVKSIRFNRGLLCKASAAVDLIS